MFDHVTIRVSDQNASRTFYELALGRPTHVIEDGVEWNDFSFYSRPPVTRNLHIAFVTRSREDVDEWWRKLTGAGYVDDGAPGRRPQYHDDYYGGFVLDPDGNSVEAVYQGRPREGDNLIDHMWIRVADLAASKQFWKTLVAAVGLRIGGERPERFHVAGDDRSFALVRDDPITENVHIAFPVDDNAAVDTFHRAMLAAGYRDNGAPGERPQYHPGYYGAFVLDPDGNNIEVVNHNRG